MGVAMQFDSSLDLLKGFHGARVLVVGDLMLDRFVYGVVERISPEAPIPVVRVEHTVDMPGGAANVARNLADLGGRVILVGVVGVDEVAEDLRERLAAMPTIEARLVTDRTRPTSLKTRYVADGQQVMRADLESCEPVAPAVVPHLAEALELAVSQADIVVLSDYAKGVLTDDVTRLAIEGARRAGKRVIVDPKSKRFAKYRGATVITPNRLELKDASGQECATPLQVASAGRRFIDERLCESLLVTLGKDGMSVIEADDAALHLPTAARQVFDVSGAGDTVVAALALGLAAGGSLVEASHLANVAAGLVVAKRGTATVTTGEIMGSLAPGGTDPSKLFSLDTVRGMVRGWRSDGLKVAFTNGCFDLLHPGHVSLLDQARHTADRLVVGINADISVSRLKGPNRPVQSEVARAIVLSAIKSVDAVVIFTEDTPLELIEMLEPDVLVKGADYTLETVVGADFVRGRGGRVVLVELLGGHSTTETVRRVAGMARG
jgi:D-beta-D-heptose 7-phosphate kinase / D-beta-D-heptose 1-phosphate adenosyltransferase